MTIRTHLARALSLAIPFSLLLSAALPAQTSPAAPDRPAGADTDAANVPAAPRPPEGSRIINLPSAEAPPAGTLTLLFTHRFGQPVEQSDVHSLYSFDSSAHIGIGLAYSPVNNLDISLYRSSNLDVYELDAKYRLFSAGPFSMALRGGEGWRTEKGLQNRNGYFAQAIFGFSIGSRIRITAVPTFVNRTAGQPFVAPKPVYENQFNVPAAISIALTHSINVQGEVTPRNGRADSRGVGWVASIEKTVLRHRFAFTVGNLRATTVDQYVGSDFAGLSPHAYFFGFNLVRQWKL